MTKTSAISARAPELTRAGSGLSGFTAYPLYQYRVALYQPDSELEHPDIAIRGGFFSVQPLRSERVCAQLQTHAAQGMREPLESGEIVIAQRLGETRSEEHTSELQSLMRISYAVFCLKKKKKQTEKSRIQRLSSITNARNNIAKHNNLQ